MLEYPIFDAIHRELLNQFFFNFCQYRRSYCIAYSVCKIKLNWPMLLLVRPAAQFSRYKVKIKVENLIFDDYVEGDPLYTEGLITRYNKQV